MGAVRHTHPIRRNSRGHAVLRLLAARGLPTDIETIMVGVEEGFRRPIDFRREVLDRLRDKDLAHADVVTGWSITRKGRELLVDLGDQAANDPVAVSIATPRTFVPAGVLSTGPLDRVPDRPGSSDFARCPSRRGDRLYHRDGRVTDLDGNEVTS